MTILDEHGLCSSSIMLLSKVTMGENLKIKSFKSSMKNMNGVVERKNRFLQEMTRTMLNDFNFPNFL
ncbi:hypothetical protein CR513_34634, partial [Mucuna pruriens]